MDANERFEYMAELFYKETNMVAPGKDSPAGFSSYSLEERIEAWKNWTECFYSDLFLLYKSNEKCVENN